MSSLHATGQRRRPGGRAIAATVLALGTAAAVGYLAAGTGAQASNVAPAITANPPEPTAPPPTLPPFPLPTGPRPSLVLDPGPSNQAPSSTAAPTTSAPTNTTEANATTTTEAGATSTAPEGGGASTAAPSQYTVAVTGAEVGCDGTIRVEYDTVAVPQPPLAANHLVVFNPAADPSDLHVVETAGNPANGSFTFEQAGSLPGAYRVFVVVAFDPTNAAGPLAVDQADIPPAPEC